ncbi:MAG: hypothetical protein WC870_03105 [Candidatus Paceibacterota bacterium]
MDIRGILLKIFIFTLIYLMVLACGGDLIPDKKENEQWHWKDVIKLGIFVGIIVLLFGGLS